VLGVLAIASPAAAQHTHTVVTPDQVQWGPASVLPEGAQIAVLEGNPAEKGHVTLRLKLPASYTIPPHWHSMTERVTVLSGALHVGAGDTLDRTASQRLAPGGFVSLPANMHHYAWTAEPTIVQIDLEGPFDIFYVNPADNPQQPSTNR
jgi:quercetin dioxygenase-like cupin family protein